MKKRLLAVLMSAAMVFGLAACGSEGESESASSGSESESSGSETESAASGETFDVGLVTIAYTDEFCTLLAQQIEEKLNEMGGYSITLTDGKNDPQIQMDLINSFIAKDVDAIILQAADCAGIVPGVNACEDAGIPLICSEVTPTEGTFTYAGPDSFDAGYMQGELLDELLPDGGEVLYLQGTSGMTHALQRLEGFQAALEDLGRSDIEILDIQDADFVKDDGMRIAETWIQKYAEGDGVSFDAIISGNDQMILGAMEALKTAGIPDGEIILMGIDGTAPAVQAVADGQLTATVFQDSDKVSDITIQCLEDIKNGEELEPEYIVDWELVTKDNCEEYM